MPSSHLPARILHPSKSSPFFRAGFTQHRHLQRLAGPRKTYARWSAPSPNIRNRFQNSAPPPKEEPPSSDTVSSALRNTSAQDNNPPVPVNIPEDPNGVLNEKHPAAKILANSAIVVQRQLELTNILAGFEQANKYVIMDPEGNHIGYIAERDLGMGNIMARQMFRTHRSFETHVFDKNEKEFHRPFAWISSRIGVYDPLEVASSSRSSSKVLAKRAPGSNPHDSSPQVSQLALSDMRAIGEAQQQWAPLRRKYNLFLYRQPPSQTPHLGARNYSPRNHSLSKNQQLRLSSASQSEDIQLGQFAYVDEPFLSWDFSLLSADSRLIGSVNRNFAGFGREIFTDTGVYALRMDAAGSAAAPRDSISKTGVAHQNPITEMTLDQRAVMLATAVSVDFDYFSRKSGSGSMMWFPWFGGAADAGGDASAEGAGEAAEKAEREATSPAGDPVLGAAAISAVAMGTFDTAGKKGSNDNGSGGAGGEGGGGGSGISGDGGGGVGEGGSVADFFF